MRGGEPVRIWDESKEFEKYLFIIVKPIVRAVKQNFAWDENQKPLVWGETAFDYDKKGRATHVCHFERKFLKDFADHVTETVPTVMVKN